MKRITQTITEAVKKEKSMVVAIGRFNPPTTGHELVCSAVKRAAASFGAEHMIYVSYSHDAKKNPLDPTTKMEFLKKFFPQNNFKLVPKPFASPGGKVSNGPFAVMQKLSDAGYTKVYVVTGADHIEEYNTIKKYIDPNPKSKKGYKFNLFQVISAGNRNASAKGVTGMSASKMRFAAFTNNYAEFLQGIPAHVSKPDAKRLFTTLRKNMNLKEEYLHEEKDEPVTVLCMTSAEGKVEGSGSTVEKIMKSCKKQGAPFQIICTKFAVINSMKADGDRLVIENCDGEGKKIEIDPKNTVCFVRGGVMNSNLGIGLLTVLQNSGVFMINGKAGMELSANKLQTAIALQRFELPHPRTAFVSDESSVKAALKSIGNKFPVVLKTITGAEGIGVSIIESEKSLRSVMQSLWKFGAELIIQEFLDGFDHDVRSLVLNGKVFAVAKRDKAKGDFRTNIARGSKGGSFELSEKEIELIEKTANISKCYYVGIDHVVAGGKPYIIEMNASSGSGNVYTLYKDGKPVKEVEGDELVDELVKHCTNKSNWKLFNSVAVVDKIIVDNHEYFCKIDTGNSGYNCIHATDIKYNEKKHEVSFKMNGDYSMVKKVASKIKIRRGGVKEQETRYVVYMDVEFAGNKYQNIKFSIADRSHMNYKVLVGVRFLNMADVTVNPKEMSPDKPEPREIKKESIEKARKLQSLCKTKKEKMLWEQRISDMKKQLYAPHMPKEKETLDEKFESILVDNLGMNTLSRKIYSKSLKNKDTDTTK